MPARDSDHESVRLALTKEGRAITHEPHTLVAGEGEVDIDLGAERTIAAEKDGGRIEVEIKSFRGRSNVRDSAQAFGQYILYLAHLKDVRPPLVVFNPEQDRIVRWAR